MINNPQIFSLANGIRVGIAHTDGDVSYIGVVAHAGSRNDPENHEGLAHFVEHTVFKGTQRRSSWAISNRMEEIGGEINAYTSKEETMIYTNAPAGYEPRALELIADLIKNASFPKQEIDKERDVIIEEIYSYRDSPADSVFDEFEELAYCGSPLAHNILGTPESVKGISGEEARRFISDWYTPENMVIYCCSPLNIDKAIRLVDKYFGDLSFPTIPVTNETIPDVPLFNETRKRDNHQANTVAGTRIFGRTDSRRFPLFLFNNYLGGPCMNSRLNLELRERRGLVYTVESNISLLSDTGLFTVFFGSDEGTVKKCMNIIEREILKLADKKMSDRTFNKIRNQYCGQLTVSSANIETRAMSIAKSILYYNNIFDISDMRNNIQSVSPEDFRNIATLIADTGLSRLTLA